MGADVADNAGGRLWSLDSRRSGYHRIQYVIVVENGTKWPNSGALGEYNFNSADAIVDHAVSVRAQVGGHALIWGRGRGQTYPEEVAVQVEQSDTPEDTLKQLMDEHIRTVTNHFKGRVDVWDVVNEHLSSCINASRPISRHEG